MSEPMKSVCPSTVPTIQLPAPPDPSLVALFPLVSPLLALLHVESLAPSPEAERSSLLFSYFSTLCPVSVFRPVETVVFVRCCCAGSSRVVHLPRALRHRRSARYLQVRAGVNRFHSLLEVY